MSAIHNHFHTPGLNAAQFTYLTYIVKMVGKVSKVSKTVLLTAGSYYRSNTVIRTPTLTTYATNDIVVVYMLSLIYFRVSSWYILIVRSLIRLLYCSCIRSVSRFKFNFSLACSAMIAQFIYFAVWLSSIK